MTAEIYALKVLALLLVYIRKMESKKKQSSQDDIKEDGEGPAQTPEGPQSWEGRPRIRDYNAGNKFRVEDEVYIISGNGRALQGPYIVDDVPAPQTYTLSFSDGSSVENGRVFKESELDFAN